MGCHAGSPVVLRAAPHLAALRLTSPQKAKPIGCKAPIGMARREKGVMGINAAMCC